MAGVGRECWIDGCLMLDAGCWLLVAGRWSLDGEMIRRWSVDENLRGLEWVSAFESKS